MQSSLHDPLHVCPCFQHHPLWQLLIYGHTHKDNTSYLSSQIITDLYYLFRGSACLCLFTATLWLNTRRNSRTFSTIDVDSAYGSVLCIWKALYMFSPFLTPFSKTGPYFPPHLQINPFMFSTTHMERDLDCMLVSPFWHEHHRSLLSQTFHKHAHL